MAKLSLEQPMITSGPPAGGEVMRRRTSRYESGTEKLMFLRPLSAAVNVVSGLSAWISVHVELQPVTASSAPELSLALSTSIFTVPTKVVATALLAAFLEMVARLTVLPATLVLIKPPVAPAAVEVSNALKFPSTRRSARMCALPGPVVDEVAVFVPLRPAPDCNT